MLFSDFCRHRVVSEVTLAKNRRFRTFFVREFIHVVLALKLLLKGRGFPY